MAITKPKKAEATAEMEKVESPVLPKETAEVAEVEADLAAQREWHTEQNSPYKMGKVKSSYQGNPGGMIVTKMH